MFGVFVTRVERFKIGAERPPVEILFRNVILRASVKEHAITCATGQQFASGLADRFRTAGWSVVLPAAQVAAEG